MRLARGSRTGGLAAPRPVQIFSDGRVHLRPLITLKKAEVVAALRAARVDWREDSSNTSGEFFRNRVRSGVLARWIEAAQRDALAGAARSRLLLEEDDSAVEAWLDELEPINARGQLLLVRLQGKPRALWRRALHRWLSRNPQSGEPSRQAFDSLLLALESGRTTRHSLGRHGFAVTDGQRLRFITGKKSADKIRRRAN